MSLPSALRLSRLAAALCVATALTGPAWAQIVPRSDTAPFEVYPTVASLEVPNAAADVLLPMDDATPMAPVAQVPAAIPDPAAPDAVDEPDVPVGQPDETALRYFARLGDERRVEAEIARLQAIYPDWTPPTDLLSEDYTADPLVERIWELFSEGDFAGARAAIAEKQEQDPAWIPSPDLLESLRLAEAAQRMRNASAASQYDLVISIAAETGELLTCDNVDLLWNLADAFIATDVKERGLDAYTYVLRNCDDAQARFTTLQQASERLTVAELDPLLALERTVNGVGEFEPLRVDLARNAITEVLGGRTMSAPAASVARLEAAVEETENPDDLRLLGWFEESRGEFDDSLEWFERAMEVDPSALSANGLGTVLLQLDRAADAEDVLVDYVEDDETLMVTYLAAAASTLATEPRIELDGDVLARIVEVAVDEESADVAQELGWYAYAFNQPATAVVWFDLALSYDLEDEASAYGIVVASDLLGDDARVIQMQGQWGTRSRRIAEFGTAGAAATAAPAAPIPPARPATLSAAPVAAPVTTTAPQGGVVTPVSTASAPASVATATATASAGAPTAITVRYQGCSNYVPAASLSADQALNRGWCLLDLLRPGEAVENFGRALQSGSQATRIDASYGQALAYIRLGLPDHAAVAAAAAPQNSQRVNELQISILTLTAVTSYQAGDYLRAIDALNQRSAYAAEQNDLLVLRAYSYFFLGRLGEAEQIFEAVAATGFRDAAIGLQTVRGALASR